MAHIGPHAPTSTSHLHLPVIHVMHLPQFSCSLLLCYDQQKPKNGVYPENNPRASTYTHQESMANTDILMFQGPVFIPCFPLSTCTVKG